VTRVSARVGLAIVSRWSKSASVIPKSGDGVEPDNRVDCEIVAERENIVLISTVQTIVPRATNKGVVVAQPAPARA